MSEVATKTKSPDPRVAAAIAHWAPRFVSNGVLLADFEEVTAGIERWEDWCRAWCERAKVHKALGRSEEHTSELQSQSNLVCRLLLEKKKKIENRRPNKPSNGPSDRATVATSEVR